MRAPVMGLGLAALAWVSCGAEDSGPRDAAPKAHDVDGLPRDSAPPSIDGAAEAIPADAAAERLSGAGIRRAPRKSHGRSRGLRSQGARGSETGIANVSRRHTAAASS